MTIASGSNAGVGVGIFGTVWEDENERARGIFKSWRWFHFIANIMMPVAPAVGIQIAFRPTNDSGTPFVPRLEEVMVMGNSGECDCTAEDMFLKDFPGLSNLEDVADLLGHLDITVDRETLDSGRQRDKDERREQQSRLHEKRAKWRSDNARRSQERHERERQLEPQRLEWRRLAEEKQRRQQAAIQARAWLAELKALGCPHCEERDIWNGNRCLRCGYGCPPKTWVESLRVLNAKDEIVACVICGRNTRSGDSICPKCHGTFTMPARDLP